VTKDAEASEREPVPYIKEKGLSELGKVLRVVKAAELRSIRNKVFK